MQTVGSAVPKEASLKSRRYRRNSAMIVVDSCVCVEMQTEASESMRERTIATRSTYFAKRVEPIGFHGFEVLNGSGGHTRQQWRWRRRSDTASIREFDSSVVLDIF